MSIALHPSLADPSNAHLLSNLIVVDISPTQAQLSPEFKGYIEGMRRIEHMKLKTRKEAAAVLENYEKVCSLSISLPQCRGHVNTTEFRYSPIPLDQPGTFYSKPTLRKLPGST